MPSVDPEIILDPHPYADEILWKLEDAGHRAVIIGGAVRDLLRDRYEEEYTFDPRDLDIDIATSAGPDEIRQFFPEFDFLEVGESFGVLIVITPDEKQYEVAQFRTESKYDGRRPGEVKPTDSLKEDVRRRDFTVNGLALEREGRIIDYVGGISDLKQKLIKSIGDPLERFKEDYLRPLRGVRIACDIGGKIEPSTSEAMVKVADKVTSISWERIREEIFKILGTRNSGWGMRFLKDRKLLEEIMPEMIANEGVPQPKQYHPEGDVLEHSFHALEVADRFEFSPLTKLAVFLHDVGKAPAFDDSGGEHMGGHALAGERLAERIASRLRISNDQTKRLTWLVGNHMKGSILFRMRRAKQVKLIRHNQDKSYPLSQPISRFSYFADLLRVILADSEASSHGVGGWLPVFEKFSDLLPHLKHLENLGSARKLIDGEDLLGLGMEEGPRLGEVLEEVHEKIYSGEIDDRESALKFAEKLARED
ncbi:MAG: CCA tRNA nucleotidyltransferase [Candidatus Bipolaricaulota bacterium]